jgi:quercetin dioxygenase-like cupin family protein
LNQIGVKKATFGLAAIGNCAMLEPKRHRAVPLRLGDGAAMALFAQLLKPGANRHGRHIISAAKTDLLLEEELPLANPPVRLIKGARIKFAPGQPTGLHRHPVSTVGLVTAGSFSFQAEGEQVRVLQTGDSFFERAGRTILRFDSASVSEPAEIVCFYLADSRETPAIEMLPEGLDSQLGVKSPGSSPT